MDAASQKITPHHLLPKFCSDCASPLVSQLVMEEACERLVCSRCGLISYLNPKVVAGAIPVQDGKILLLRRGIEPCKGAWTYPAGFVEIGETVLEGAVRETLEETGIDIQTEGLLNVYSYPNTGVAVVVFKARVLGGSLRTCREASEICAFLPEEIPWHDLAFRSTKDALTEWLERSRP